MIFEIQKEIMSKQAIGHLLKERRDHLKITQSQVADLATISVNTLYKIERGQANPTLESLEKITDVLGLELSLKIKKINL